LRQALEEAKSKGFRPETLFVSSGEYDLRYGVVLTRSDPELLWEVRGNLNSKELESEESRMRALAYIPEQIVGHSTGATSVYLACWTRDLRHYPTTGQCERAISSVDEALESFLSERGVSVATLALFRGDSQVASRGFGYADRDKREALGPDAQMQLGNLSVPFLAAAAYSLSTSKGINKETRLSDLFRTHSNGRDEKQSSAATGTGKAEMTIGGLLNSIDPSAPPLSDVERKALAASISVKWRSSYEHNIITDYDFRGVLLGEILAAVSGKTPGEVVAAEVIRPLKLSSVVPAKAASESREGEIQLIASAGDVGRFFLKHDFDGRPLEPSTNLKAGALICEGRESLGVVLRRNGLLFIVLLRIPDDAPGELGVDLKACLNRTVDSLPTPRPLDDKGPLPPG
jgi:hypothetical protein